MSSAVYTTSNVERPLAVQDDFAQNFDLENPVAAVNNYARVMREHTQKQMQTATASSRRRSGNEDAPVSSMSHLGKEGSLSSVSSNGSA